MIYRLLLPSRNEHRDFQEEVARLRVLRGKQRKNMRLLFPPRLPELAPCCKPAGKKWSRIFLFSFRLCLVLLSLSSTSKSRTSPTLVFINNTRHWFKRETFLCRCRWKCGIVDVWQFLWFVFHDRWGDGSSQCYERMTIHCLSFSQNCAPLFAHFRLRHACSLVLLPNSNSNVLYRGNSGNRRHQLQPRSIPGQPM